MNRHILKSHPKYFEGLWSGAKTFEIRVNDRDFKVGDFVVFREFDPSVPPAEGETKEQREAPQYTGRTLSYWISYLFEGDESIGLVLPDKVCVLGIIRDGTPSADER